jgi:putative membrane protein
MTWVIWISALLAAVIHVLAFTWEVVLFQRPGVHSGVFAIPTADVPPVRLWSFNVGFYNLFLAVGLVTGVIVWILGNASVGRTLVTYVCLFMFLAGVVLFISDRLALSRPRGAGVGGAISQSVPPLVALVALAVSWE